MGQHHHDLEAFWGDEEPEPVGGGKKFGPADEPALYTGGLLGLFAAVVVMANAFEWISWTAPQQVAVAGVAVIVLPALQGLVTRQFVRPVARSIPKPDVAGEIPPTPPVTGAC